MHRPAAPILALLSSTLLLSAAGAAERGKPEQNVAVRSAIPLLEGAEPSNVPETLKDPVAADVTITGHILEPKQAKPSAALLKHLAVPEGFTIAIFADGIGHPRMIRAGKDGAIYVTDRDEGKVTLLKDGDGDGRAEIKKTVAEKKNMHGIAIDGDTAYLMPVNEIYTAPIKADGTFGDLTEIAGNFPDGGQHADRTLDIGPDGKLYVSVGSTCNACNETSRESATMMRMDKNGENRTIFASGLRNTIGFGFEPQTGELYGFDHGIDWLGDDEQPEEFNHIGQNKKYGWPYIYADGQFNPQDEPPEGLTMEDWARNSVEPVLMYTPHAAPMQMDFARDERFSGAFKGDAFAAMRGSWNRKPPSGYEIVRVDFENGQPKTIEPFISGFLMKGEDGGWQQMGRLAGLAFGPDGAMYVSDDQNGVVYRIAYQHGEVTSATTGGGETKPAAAQ